MEPFIYKEVWKPVSDQGKWCHATLRHVHQDADSTDGDTSLQVLPSLLVGLAVTPLAFFLATRFPAMIHLASLESGVAVEMIALLLPDATDRGLMETASLSVVHFLVLFGQTS